MTIQRSSFIDDEQISQQQQQHSSHEQSFFQMHLKEIVRLYFEVCIKMGLCNRARVFQGK